MALTLWLNSKESNLKNVSHVGDTVTLQGNQAEREIYMTSKSG